MIINDTDIMKTTEALAEKFVKKMKEKYPDLKIDVQESKHGEVIAKANIELE